MSYSVPRTTGQALSASHASGIESAGMALVLLEHCSRLLVIQLERLSSIEPKEARNFAESQLSSIDNRVTQQKGMLGDPDAPIDGETAIKVNVSVFQTYQLSRQMDDLIGEGPTQEFLVSIAEGFGTVFGGVAVGVGGILEDAAGTVRQTIRGVGYAGQSLAWVIYVIYALAIILVVAVAYSLRKGVIPK